MPRRRRMATVKINTKLIMDVAFASLIVQKAPQFIGMVIPLDPMISKVAGVGAGWLTGVLAKRPDISNSSLALGVIDFITPFVDQLIGGNTELLPEPSGAPTGELAKSKYKKMPVRVADFTNLNDYISNPGVVQPFSVYRSSY